MSNSKTKRDLGSLLGDFGGWLQYKVIPKIQEDAKTMCKNAKEAHDAHAVNETSKAVEKVIEEQNAFEIPKGY
jgi:hypothetical protein